ncbi:MAG: hypothetical protein K5799_11400 [Erythrobacter sp.]|nr:hypothetical protein [Erythrobacter sp.]
MSGYDTAFRDAVFAAAKGVKHGGALANMLRSNQAFNSDMRELLALLVEGSLKRIPGKRAKHPKQMQNWIAVFYLERVEAGEKSDSVLADLKDLFEVERSTVLGWVAEIHAFEEAYPVYAERRRKDIKSTCATDY